MIFKGNTSETELIKKRSIPKVNSNEFRTLVESNLLLSSDKSTNKNNLKGFLSLKDICNKVDLTKVIDSLPDPRFEQILFNLDPSWMKIVDFVYIRIGRGLEDLPSSSISCNSSRCQSKERN